jgi:putative permease
MLDIFRDFSRRYLSDPQAIMLAVLVVTGFAIVLLFGRMLLPVIASLVIAYLLDDLAVMVERFGASRMQAVWLVFLLFIATFVFVIIGLVPLLSIQVSNLVGELPQMMSRGQELLLTLPNKYAFVSEEQVQEVITTVKRQIGALGQNALSFSVARIPGAITTIVYLVMMPLLVFFFLKDKEKIIAWLKTFLPGDRRLMYGVWREMDHQIGNYVRGKFWEMLVVGGASAIVFGFMGLNYAILLAVLVGLSVIVPYVGAVVVTIPVVLIAFFQWGLTPQFGYLVLAYTIIQGLDGTVLVPLLFSEVVNLHPIAIIVAVLVFGGWWGFWGVFFAIPLASLVQVLINSWPRPAVSESGS